MINTIKGGFTMILSVTLLCLPASWTFAANYTAHIRMNVDKPAYISRHIEEKLIVAKCCLFDNILNPGSSCKLSYHCIPGNAPLQDKYCFNFAQQDVYADSKGRSTYQSCTYSTADGYTPQEGEYS